MLAMMVPLIAFAASSGEMATAERPPKVLIAVDVGRADGEQPRSPARQGGPSPSPRRRLRRPDMGTA
jgi:hypothetical protein